MNTTSINILSAAVGALALSLVLVPTGATAPLPATQRVFFENVQDMNSWPNPKNMVVIRGNVPYTVPADKLFVLTALGSTNNTSALISFMVDNVREIQALPEVGAGGLDSDAPTMKPVPPGLTAPAGSVVSLGIDPEDRAWGYLVDA